MDLTIRNMPGTEAWVLRQEYEERNGPPEPNAVLRFYGPEGLASPRGTLDEILARNEREFDNVYHYAAILFPLPEAGDKNAIAPPVNEDTMRQFRHPANKHLRDNLRRAFDRCLDFFHLQLLDKELGDDERKFPGRFAIAIPKKDFETYQAPFPNIPVPEDCEERFWSLREMFDGRYKMLGRMIKSCRVLGLYKEGLALYFGLRYIYRKADNYGKLPRPPAMFHWHTATFCAFSYSIDEFHNAPRWLFELDAKCRENYFGMEFDMERKDIKQYIRSLTWVEGDIATLKDRYYQHLKDIGVKSAGTREKKRLERATDLARMAANDNHRARKNTKRMCLRKDIVSEDPKDYLKDVEDDELETSSEEELDSDDYDWKCLDWDSDDESDYCDRGEPLDRYNRKRRGYAYDQYDCIADMHADMEDIPSNEEANHRRILDNVRKRGENRHRGGKTHYHGAKKEEKGKGHGDVNNEGEQDDQVNHGDNEFHRAELRGKGTDSAGNEADGKGDGNEADGKEGDGKEGEGNGEGNGEGIYAPDGTWMPAGVWMPKTMEEYGFTTESGYPISGIWPADQGAYEQWLAMINDPNPWPMSSDSDDDDDNGGEGPSGSNGGEGPSGSGAA